MEQVSEDVLSIQLRGDNVLDSLDVYLLEVFPGKYEHINTKDLHGIYLQLWTPSSVSVGVLSVVYPLYFTGVNMLNLHKSKQWLQCKRRELRE